QVGAPDAVAPLQLLIEHMTHPQAVGINGRRVDDDLMAVPRLNRGNVSRAVLQLALLDFAGTAIALRRLLVAGPQMATHPLTVLLRDQADAFVAGKQNIHALAAGRRDRPEVVDDVNTLVNHFGRPAVARGVLRNVEGDGPHGPSVHPVVLARTVAPHERA